MIPIMRHRHFRSIGMLRYAWCQSVAHDSNHATPLFTQHWNAALRAALASGLCGDGNIATPLSVHYSDPQHWNAALVRL